jgi:hypothetical protein
MKSLLRSKIISLVLVVSILMTTVQCGFILYPERRGKVGNFDPHRIDPVVLIMDCAWLFVFIVPGVVALIVDATTGCLYDANADMYIHPGQKFAFRLRGAAPQDAKVEVVLEQKGAVAAELIAQDVAQGQALTDSIAFGIPETLNPGKYKLTMKVNGKTMSSWNVNIK